MYKICHCGVTTYLHRNGLALKDIHVNMDAISRNDRTKFRRLNLEDGPLFGYSATATTKETIAFTPW